MPQGLTGDTPMTSRFSMFLLALCLISSAPARATSCAFTHTIIKGTPFAIKATVVNTRSEPGRQEIELEVQGVLRGWASSTEVMSGPGGRDQRNLLIGNQYLIFTSRVGGRLYIDGCTLLFSATDSEGMSTISRHLAGERWRQPL
jgi:hypothetical protein